ncbi:hypothetical protein, partial [Chromobacterium amazonense]|uniref:hypothetical protein n=1 Tax=Chromobacterium amazonense TaxID=1382803 RepID=UPI003F7AEA70
MAGSIISTSLTSHNSRSQPQPEINTTGLINSLSSVAPSAARLSHSLATESTSARDFPIQVEKQARYALFAVAGSPNATKLERMFNATRSLTAKAEINAFATAYHELCLLDLAPKTKERLDALAKDYTTRILCDGLGDRTAFGTWSPDNATQYEQRSQLERQLASLVEQSFKEAASTPSDAFLKREVIPFIKSCVETQLGGALEATSLDQLHHLVDQRAREAVARLNAASSAQGVRLGKLSRDLGLLAMLPQLLRGVQNGASSATMPSASGPAGMPPADGPAAAVGSQPALGAGGCNNNRGVIINGNIYGNLNGNIFGYINGNSTNFGGSLHRDPNLGGLQLASQFVGCSNCGKAVTPAAADTVNDLIDLTEVEVGAAAGAPTVAADTDYDLIDLTEVEDGAAAVTPAAAADTVYDLIDLT